MERQMLLLATEVSVEVDGYLWFVPLRENALYKMDVSNYLVEYVTRFELETTDAFLFAKMVFYEGKLFLIPSLSERITVYVIATGEKVYLDYKRNYILLGQGKRFTSGIVNDNYLYMIPGNFREIICMNMDNYDLKYHDISSGEMAGGIGAEKGIGYSYKSQEVVGDEIYIPVLRHEGILVFNMKELVHKYIYPGKKNEVYEGIFQINNKYILIPKGKNVLYIWDEQIDEIEKQINMPSDFTSGMINFYCGKVFDNKLYLLQWYSNMSIVMDFEKKTLNKLELPDQNKALGIYKWVDFIMHRGKFMIIAGESEEWYTVQQEECSPYPIYPEIDAKSLSKRAKDEGILFENNRWALREYLKMFTK